MRLQVKLYADDGRRIWDNNYDVNLSMDATIKVVDEELNTKLGSVFSSNTHMALKKRIERTSFQAKNGNNVIVERKVRK